MTLRRITLATTLIPLLTVSAVAQNAIQTPSPNDRALQLLIQGAVARELSATTTAIQFRDQVEALQQQVTADQKRIAELTKPGEPAKPDSVPAAK